MKLFIISWIHPGILKIVWTGLQSKKDVEVEHWQLRLLQASRRGSECFDHFVQPNILFNGLLVAVQLVSHVRLCDPRDCSPPGSSVHGISQARILERVAIPFSRGSSQSTSYLLDVLFANVFSHSFGCLFTFLCPLEHKNFWFWWSPVYFFFGYLCFSVISEKPLLHPRFMKIYAYVIFLGILYFLLLHLSLWFILS